MITNKYHLIKSNKQLTALSHDKEDDPNPSPGVEQATKKELFLRRRLFVISFRFCIYCISTEAFAMKKVCNSVTIFDLLQFDIINIIQRS